MEAEGCNEINAGLRRIAAGLAPTLLLGRHARRALRENKAVGTKTVILSFTEIESIIADKLSIIADKLQASAWSWRPSDLTGLCPQVWLLALPAGGKARNA